MFLANDLDFALFLVFVLGHVAFGLLFDRFLFRASDDAGLQREAVIISRFLVGTQSGQHHCWFDSVLSELGALYVIRSFPHHRSRFPPVEGVLWSCLWPPSCHGMQFFFVTNRDRSQSNTRWTLVLQIGQHIDTEGDTLHPRNVRFLTYTVDPEHPGQFLLSLSGATNTPDIAKRNRILYMDAACSFAVWTLPWSVDLPGAEPRMPMVCKRVA